MPLQAVKGRPVAVSAALAAFTLFLARAPIKSAITGFFSDEEEPTGGGSSGKDTKTTGGQAPSGQSEGVSA